MTILDMILKLDPKSWIYICNEILDSIDEKRNEFTCCIDEFEFIRNLGIPLPDCLCDYGYDACDRCIRDFLLSEVDDNE